MNKRVSCKNCHYWRHSESDWSWKGACHRYPKRVTTDDSYWCGEFKPKKGGRTMPEKLKPCPFCGGEWKDFAELIEEVRND